MGGVYSRRGAADPGGYRQRLRAALREPRSGLRAVFHGLCDVSDEVSASAEEARADHHHLLGRVGAVHACRMGPAADGGALMEDGLILRNHLAQVRKEKGLSQAELAKLVGVSRNTISSIETGQFNPTAKLALIICIALDKKFEELFYF